MDRLGMLRKMAQTRGGEPFMGYGLAMELRKQGQLDEAKTTFAALVEAHPDYMASYLMFGNLLAQRRESTEALAIYDRGIAVAARLGDDHAQSELEAAKAEIA